MDRQGLTKLQQYVFERCVEIMTAKNHDYSGEKKGAEDPFRNLKMCERVGVTDAARGVLVRLCDKYARLTAFLDNDGRLAVPSEKVEDTVIDAINYCVLLLGLTQEMRGEGLGPEDVRAMQQMGAAAGAHLVQTVEVPAIERVMGEAQDDEGGINFCSVNALPESRGIGGGRVHTLSPIKHPRTNSLKKALEACRDIGLEAVIGPSEVKGAFKLELRCDAVPGVVGSIGATGSDLKHLVGSTVRYAIDSINSVRKAMREDTPPSMPRPRARKKVEFMDADALLGELEGDVLQVTLLPVRDGKGWCARVITPGGVGCDSYDDSPTGALRKAVVTRRKAGD